MTCHRLHFEGLTCNDSAVVPSPKVPQQITYNDLGYELKTVYWSGAISNDIILPRDSTKKSPFIVFILGGVV